MQNPVEVIFQNMDSVPNLVYGFVLIVIIAFANEVPFEVRGFADTAIGRLIGVSLIIAATRYFGWVYGLLTALAFVLILAMTPRLAAIGVGQAPLGQQVEAFQDLQKRETLGNRWYVERVLGEHPVGIETETVYTTPVQDLSTKSMGSR